MLKAIRVLLVVALAGGFNEFVGTKYGVSAKDIPKISNPIIVL